MGGTLAKLEEMPEFRVFKPGWRVHAGAVMFSEPLLASLQSTLSEIESAGLYKRERLIDSPQNATVRLKDGRTVINMCANNYLGPGRSPGGDCRRPRGA
jgi:hypothetical protein